MSSSPYSIRPIDPVKDAADIAQLVDRCFRPWLDRENTEYLKSLREEGLYTQKHPFLSRISSFPYKLDGVVYRDGHEDLLGVINSYPFTLKGQQCSLLANICVDPSHRQEGIASRMLGEAEAILRSKGIRDIFLQARMEKPEVIAFYKKRSFCVTDYRETWVRPYKRAEKAPRSGDIRLERVPRTDMERFGLLMEKAYPSSILWNLDHKRDLFQPGAAADIRNRIDSLSNRFRRVTDGSGELLAWTAYQKHSGFADILWLIPAEDLSGSVYASILSFLGTEAAQGRAMKMDIAAGKDPEIFRSAGFHHMQTLAWMWKKL